MKSELLNLYFSSDLALHADMVDSLWREQCDILYAGEDGALLYDIPGDTYLVSAATDERAKYLAKLLGDADSVTLHGTRFAKRFRHPSRPKEREWLCAGYTSKTRPKIHSGFDIRTLERKYLPIVLENYHGTDDKAYIEARFLSGMIGAFDGDELMGFIGTHDGGEIGFLHTMEKYRGRGVAYALETEMTIRYLDEGRIPYGLISPDNEISKKLALKVGYTISDERMVWFYRHE